MGFTEVERSIITEENIMLYWKMTDVPFNLIIQIFRFIWLVRDLPLIIVLNSFTRKMFGLRLKTLIVFPCVSVLPRLWFSFQLRRPVVFAARTAVRFKTTEGKPSKLCEEACPKQTLNSSALILLMIVQPVNWCMKVFLIGIVCGCWNQEWQLW